MKEILSENGDVILIDDDNYEAAIKYEWRVIKGAKYCKVITLTTGKRETYKNLILGICPSKRSICINGNYLDLRKENLRIFDTSEEFMSFIRQEVPTYKNE